MHTFWLTLIVPAVILSQWIWPVLKIRSIWSISAVVVAILAIGWIALGFVDIKPDQQNIFGVLMMGIFRIISATDLPLIQLLIACVVGWFRCDQTHWIPAADLAEPSIASQ